MERSEHHLMSNLFLVLVATAVCIHGDNQTAPFHVGVLLDLDTLVGKMGWISILMAIDDFYDLHRNYTTRVVLHARDTNNDIVQAAASAIDLLENSKVKAIIGPQKSSQAIFLSELADKSQVNGPLSSIIEAFGWKEVVPIYEDTEYGRGILPYLIDTFQGMGTSIAYRSLISLLLTDDQIMKELYKLMTMEARVFIVHMTPPIGARFFAKAEEVGMMSKGYAWIMTSGLSNIVDSLDQSVIQSMQGSLGMKLYVPKSKEINEFSARWKRRFQQENPLDQPAVPSIFEFRAYDTAWALAIAAEKVGVEKTHLQKSLSNSSSTSLDTLSSSTNGPKLLEAILNCRFGGLSGQFHLLGRELQSSTFKIINIVGKGERQLGFWTPKYGISRKLNPSIKETYSTAIDNLNPIIWPGETSIVPKGWQTPVSGKKLRIGVPIKDDFQEFVKVEKDPITNAITVTGFSIDVFEAVVQSLPYAISYDYIPFADVQGKSAGSYDDLVYQVHLQNYDAVVGDVAIIANRSMYVDFTLPYTETGVAMLVPVKENINKCSWIFLKPLTWDLWLASFAFFLFTGFVVWVMEHRINNEFRGPFSQQIGTVLYFAFSMLVFAHREKIKNVLSRLVVIIWLFAVLILTSSYTANLSSMLTVEQQQPIVSDVNQLKMSGDYIGYQKGTFEEGLLKQHQFDERKMRSYNNPDEYAEALSKGSKNGGVAAIFHGIPYIKLFLAKHCTGYTMVGPVYKAGGMGFVFPKGSPLLPDISRGILNVTEGDIMVEIEKKWFGEQVCLNEGNTVSSNNLTFHSFSGVFLITGTASASILFIFLTQFFYKNWNELKIVGQNKSIWQTLNASFKFYNKKDASFYIFNTDKIVDEDSTVRVNGKQGSSITFSESVDNIDDTSSFSYSPDVNSSFQRRNTPYRIGNFTNTRTVSGGDRLGNVETSPHL
ncbi:glutamate receptor 2.7-like isoform X2 [Asparagus officinalis]|uniref:glutamate receptor 2.7-like isoform X2 n=1 Tax=Asparagus officinalis TaxID=4686 RepID=UPI00098E7B2C|nr:glutamate receptor 2.7-like isoform X2 [Asparagus officinalis]